jgi:hypothetical protein
LEIQLRNATQATRVHVFATRYRPEFLPLPIFGRVRDVEPVRNATPPPKAHYVEGRRLGDELRYILDRKYAEKHPGNMLERPSLLLNPWALRTTETQQQEPVQGQGVNSSASQPGDAPAPAEAETVGTKSAADFANLDFLAQASSVLLNLVPDEQGTLLIPRSTLGSHTSAQIVAVDHVQTVSRSVALPPSDAPFVDLRLHKPFDAGTHFSRQQRISVVQPDMPFVLDDIATSRFEAYDSVARVFGLYQTLLKDPKLVEFSFITRWHTLSDAEKREKYSKFACHELAFFLFKKDPQFFRTVVQPYLANKSDPTFLDRWLLEADLADRLTPRNYEQLNIVECIILAQRVPGEMQHTSQFVHNLYDLIPPDPERFDFLFNTAIHGSVLNVTDELGLRRKQGEARPERRLMLGEKVAESAPPQPVAIVVSEAENTQPGAPRDTVLSFRNSMAQDAKQETGGTILNGAAAASERGRQSLARRVGGKAVDDLAVSGRDADKVLFGLDARLRERTRQFFQPLDKTQEWAENNYYQLPIEQQNAQLVTANAFWRDYAAHDPAKPFFSLNLAEASRSFTEVMLALAVLDVPFEAGQHETVFDDNRMTLRPASPMVVFHEEIRPASKVLDPSPMLVSQNYFRRDDRYHFVNNERQDKYVTDEFLTRVVYCCQVVLTNPTSSSRKVHVLVQVPQGALPVLAGYETRSVPMDLQPFTTQAVEYCFYFPLPGEFVHYPVQVTQHDDVLAFARPSQLTVLAEPSRVDKDSWAYVSQFGSDESVLDYLRHQNLRRIDLDKIAFRMHAVEFFDKVTALLSQRHAYQDTLWSYGIKHNRPEAIRQFLAHNDAFVAKCGLYINTPILAIDPVERKLYQQLDYHPLVNARAHQLGGKRQILNDRLLAQYLQLLKVLSYRPRLDDTWRMAVVYYLLLQDRVTEAGQWLAEVNPDRLTTRIQYDYFMAYVSFSKGDPITAREIADKYENYPVDRWRMTFDEVRAQVEEITDPQARIVDRQDRDQRQAGLASTEPGFEFRVESLKVRLDYQNLSEVQVNFYVMDIELLFSRNPFVQAEASQFSYIQPNMSQTMTLPAGQSSVEFDLPAGLHNSNTLIEIIGAGQTKSQAYYANSLALQMSENYGRLRVTDATQHTALAGVYVKVYAQLEGGNVQFYKDGYTDLRGRFDYATLSTNQLDFVQKFSVLVLSDEHGAVIREANPPRR